ncbi:sensor histidine kinase [Sphingomonas aracearum]|uniref:histidine kinase n=1 Tax=Sphingomonas aracearum TaxID=2283317 RepID=A0A369VTQ5_9SPHN|nr:ATP-binding protein [Sphingomonas aracearum]RDE04560.1 histidine kinase [Sphingomonas aracearum]
MIASRIKRFGVGEGLANRFLVTCMALGFASVIIAVVAAAWMTTRTQELSRWVSHTYEVEIAITQALNGVEQAEATRRGYLLTGQEIYRTTYVQAATKVQPALWRVHWLSRDNPEQQRNLAALRRELNDLQRVRNASVALMAAGDRPAAVRLFADETGARRMRRIRDRAGAMVTAERVLLDRRREEQAASLRAFYVTLGIAGVLLVLSALASLATVLRYTSDLGTSRDQLQSLNDSLETLVAERTEDLTRANEEIQRFAYIVSHDLRSPLVNVMGFTAELDAATSAIGELIDRAEERAPDIVTDEARFAAREDLPEAIGFIRTSTQKMDRLINAILKLSREGRRVLLRETVDVAALADGIAASLQHRLDEQGTTITVQRPMPEMTTDRLALEQILSNLIENAVKYLQPGRPGRIVVRGSAWAGRTIIEVEDNGRGISAHDHQRIFDLFRRSGQQDQPGEGIGLAHVRALAYRLGGTIDVRSEFGQGSTFRLSLPTVMNEEAR